MGEEENASLSEMLKDKEAKFARRQKSWPGHAAVQRLNLTETTITLDHQPGKELGLSLQVGDASMWKRGAIIVAKSGLIADWNSRHPTKQIQSGDRLMAINGNRGSP